METKQDSYLDARFKYYAILTRYTWIDAPYFEVISRLVDMALEGLSDKLSDSVKFAYCWMCQELQELGIVEDWFFECFVRCVAPEHYDMLFKEK